MRRFSPHVTWNAYYGFDGKIQSGRGHWHPIEFQPHSGGRFGVFVDRMQDRPVREFTVFAGADDHRVVIPPGLYGVDGGDGKPTWATPAPALFPTFYCRTGGFLRRDTAGAATPASTAGSGPASRRASAGTGMWWTFRSESSPPTSSRCGSTIRFPPLRRLEALIQYNSQTASVSSNIRLVLLDRSGTGLFLVYNDLRNTANFDRFDPDTGIPVPTVMGRSLIVKYTRLFDF